MSLETKIVIQEEYSLESRMEGRYWNHIIIVFIWTYLKYISNARDVDFFVRNDISFSVRNDLSATHYDFETSWVNLHNYNYNILCGVVYRHPTANLETFTKYFNSILDKIQNSNKMCIILGDFNINLLKSYTYAPTQNFRILLIPCTLTLGIPFNDQQG